MPALGRVLIGFRENKRRQAFYDDHEMPYRVIRACAAGCGYPVVVLQSAFATMRDNDPEVICEECGALYKVELEAGAL